MTAMGDSVRGGTWINDGYKQRRLRAGVEVPPGWLKGRIDQGTRGMKIPKLQGKNNPAYRKVVRAVGFDILPKSDRWRSIAGGILKKCQTHNIPFGFANHHELSFYLKEIDPIYCPVFGFKMEKTVGALGCFDSRTSPNVDRIIPALGYVRGNLQIISGLANVMKSNATPEQLVMFAKWALKEYGN